MRAGREDGRKYRAVSGANQSLACPGLLPVKIATPAGGQAEKALAVVLVSSQRKLPAAKDPPIIE